MLTVNAISTPKLVNSMHASFMHAVCSQISEQGDSPLGLPDGFCANMLQAIEREQDIVNRTLGSPLTEQIQAQDELRSNCFRAVHYMLKNLRYASDQSLRNLYDIALKKLIKPYSINSVLDESNHKTSALLRGFAYDVRQFLTAEQINKIGLKGDLEEMEAANEEYETLYLERVKEQTENVPGVALKYRAEVDGYYQELVITLNYYGNQQNNPDSGIKSIALSARSQIDLLNKHIDTVRRSIKASTSNKEDSGSGTNSGTGGGSTIGTSGAKPTDKPTEDKPIDKPLDNGSDSGYNGDL